MQRCARNGKVFQRALLCTIRRQANTIAAASYRDARSFIDRNFSHKTYFTQALNGDLSSFQVSRTTTGERGHFCAAIVENSNRTVGVLAIKFNIAAFESV